MPKFLKSSALVAASVLILLQGVLLRSAVRPESIPSSAPLSALPLALGKWQFLQEGVVDDDTMRVLRADDVLNRTYAAGSSGANLFVAAFRSQRNGKAPHSPKNCLPGSGWTPLNSGEYSIDVGEAAPISVNKYVVAFGDQRSVVLYWYQSRERVIADEYKAKFWVVMDAMRLNRTDTALVRIVVPVVERDEEAATRTASDFVRALYKPLRLHLPE
ncbi:MAG: exosortase C-terminal domain/associated protein EpsI [Bryobacteraceae bacterium]